MLNYKMMKTMMMIALLICKKECPKVRSIRRRKLHSWVLLLEEENLDPEPEVDSVHELQCCW